MTRSELEIIIKKRAAIVVTALAALLAVNGYYGGSNSSKILSNVIAANNQWAWYQAKNVRSVIYETSNRPDDAKRMKADMEEISVKAKALEAEREKAQARSPFFTYSGIGLQLGIVLSTAAILAVLMPLFWASVGVGSIGALLFFFAMFGA
jgi:hypothetical protein